VITQPGVIVQNQFIGFEKWRISFRFCDCIKPLCS